MHHPIAVVNKMPYNVCMKQHNTVSRLSPLPDSLAQDLLQRILRGEFDQTGMLPSERQLQAQYAVSRPVVRESIKLLSARGIVSPSNGVGALINDNLSAATVESLMLLFHQQQVRLSDLLATRVIIEPQVASLAAEHASDAHIAAMYDACADMRALDMAAPDAGIIYNQLNVDFHVQLARLSHNPVLITLMELLVGMVWRHERTSNLIYSTERYQLTANEHQAIVDAIADHNPHAAQVAMADHLCTTKYQLQVGTILNQRLQAILMPLQNPLPEQTPRQRDR